MSTINISLPSRQADIIDSMVIKYGFANRSEFIRTIIRLVIGRKELVEQAVIFPFIPAKKQSVETIITAFSKTNRYSKKFLKDLEEGLAESDYFKS